MPIYEKPPIEVAQRIDRLLKRYHGPLADAETEIDCWFARPKPAGDGEIDPEACALRLHGYPVQALVRVNSYKHRVQGHGDAEILVDGERWEELSDEERDALLDHELEHIELKTDKDGNVVRDDLDRPKLRLRRHDHQFGWFDAVARRHGKASQEAQQYEAFKKAHRQLWLEFDKETAA